MPLILQQQQYPTTKQQFKEEMETNTENDHDVDYAEEKCVTFDVVI